MSEKIECPACDGQGFFPIMYLHGRHGKIYCQRCEGAGKINNPTSVSREPSLLGELCAALGWQGGTRQQALDEVRRLAQNEMKK